MGEQIFKRKFAGRYESEDYRINHHYSTGVWEIVRKSDKKKAYCGTLKRAKEFLKSTGATDERNRSL